MPQLTNRQRYLLELLNQLSQNSNSDNRLNPNFSIDLPEINVDLGGINLGGGTSTPPGQPNDPTTVREVLQNLVNEQVEVTTPFGAVTGTLIAVRDDYIVLIESGEQVLVRIEKIELVNEL